MDQADLLSFAVFLLLCYLSDYLLFSFRDYYKILLHCGLVILVRVKVLMPTTDQANQVRYLNHFHCCCF